MERHQLFVVRMNEGEVAFGWLANGVFYTRCQGVISATLGLKVASQLDRVLAKAESCRLFSDCSGVETYDFTARNTLIRVFFSRRKQFERFEVLATKSVILLAVRAVAPMFGGTFSVLEDDRAFRANLHRAVPVLGDKLDPRTWTPVRSSLPPAY